MFKKKKLLAALLALSMVITPLPSVPVYAEESAEDISLEENSEVVSSVQDSSEDQDLTVKVAGSNGILYSDVAYLSAASVASMDEGGQEAYLAMCDEVALWKENEDAVSDIVISLDEEGNLELSYLIRFETVAEKRKTETQSGEAAENAEKGRTETESETCSDTAGSEEEESRETVSGEEEGSGAAESSEEEEGSAAENSEEEESSTIESGEEEESSTAESGEEEESSTAESSEEEESSTIESSEEEESSTIESSEEEESSETESSTEEESIETEESAESEGEIEEESETETDIGKTQEETDAEETFSAAEEERIIEENVVLAQSYEVPEEMIGGSDFIQTDSLFWKNDNFYYDQLSSDKKRFYDAGYKKMVKGNSNSFSITGGYIPNVSYCVVDALSALVDTYPIKLDWRSRGPNSGCRISHIYSKGKYTYYVRVIKSKYYSASLESAAYKKVDNLLQEANAYAAEYYPSAPAYGMIRYFDKWLCENNYYNYTGTSDDETVRSGDIYYYCHSCYGILLKGYGVCESYALAMSRLLDAAGIPNLYIVGNAGGRHAWNYIQMPNENWYMVDSTWNDRGSYSSGKYLLCKSDGVHVADGLWYITEPFEFMELAPSDYSVEEESVTLDFSTIVLKPKESRKLTVSNTTYYDKFGKVWSSSDPKVAKVDKNGKVTGVAPGKAAITLNIAGKKVSCTVYVYQFTGLTFHNNSKSSYQYSYENPDTVFNASDIVTLTLTAGQKNRQISAESVVNHTGIAAPKVTAGNRKVAEIYSCTLSGDTVTLRVKAVGVGTSTIKVQFGGKTATLTYKVTQKLQDGWFGSLPYTKAEYTGTAFKPRITLTAAAPKGVKYSVKYENNKNAGNAKIVIKGTGNYSGEIVRSFTITARSIEGGTVSCTKSRGYTGKVNKASISVKVKKKALKAGADYDVYYERNGSRTQSPQNKGVYTVTIIGKGNYTGTMSDKTYEITAAPLSKVSVSCSASVKYTGNNVYPTVKVKLGKTVLTTTDYSVAYYNAQGVCVTPKEKGKYTVVITPKGNIAASGTKTSIKKSFTVK